jgi:hypothetical protein
MAIYGSSVFASSATFCSVQSSRGIGVRLQCSCAGCLIMRRPGPCYDYGCSCAIYICVKYWMGVCCLRGSGTSKFPSIKYICKHANRRSCLVFTFRLSRVRRCTTVRSTSGPPDGRSTGCLASHTSGCTVRLLHCRSIDERTRWATFSADLLSGQSTSRDQLAGIRATVTSTSGPPDGRSTGCLASHTSADTIRCSHSRQIDEQTRWATSVKL